MNIDECVCVCVCDSNESIFFEYFYFDYWPKEKKNIDKKSCHFQQQPRKNYVNDLYWFFMWKK